MTKDVNSRSERTSLAKHARLFELLRQQNLIASSRIGRKKRPLDEGHAASLLAAADASFGGAAAA